METYADDALGANQLNQGVGDGALGVALAIGLEVTEITDVADIVGTVAVVLAVGVDCCDVSRASSPRGCSHHSQ